MKYSFPVPEGFEPPEESSDEQNGAIGAIKYYIKDNAIYPMEFEGFEVPEKPDEEPEKETEKESQNPAYQIFRKNAKG